MLFNYIKLAIRLLIRNPFSTLINLAGLSVGFVVFFILWQYSESELKSDQQWKDSQRIYRFGAIAQWTDDKVHWEESAFGGNDAALASQVAQQYSEVESMTRILVQDNFGDQPNYETYTPHGRDIFFSVLQAGQKSQYLESRVAYADPNMFFFFSIPLIRGNAKNCLSLAWSAVLSEEKAKKYFGNDDPVGKLLLLNGKISLTVTGVFKNLPRNTHFDFDIVLSSQGIITSMSTYKQPFFAPHCYFKVRKDTDARHLANRINSEFGNLIKRVMYGSWEYGNGLIYLQPLAEVPFTSYRQDFYQSKSKTVLIILKYASILILAMAWINFVNLTLSSNLKRLKEVAARKTVGARPVDFMIQFVVEALIINWLSLLLAITIIQLLRSPIEVLFHFYILEWDDFSLSTVLIILITLNAAIILTGVYPALNSLKQSPKNLFGALKANKNNNKLNVALTTFQFSGAIIFIIWIFTVFGQMQYVLKKDLGLDKEHTIVLDLPINRSKHFYTDLNAFLQKISAQGLVKHATVSQSVPSDGKQQFIAMTWKKDDAGIVVESNGGVDEHFIPFYNINLLAGRNFLPDHPADSSSVVLSEAAASRLGFKSPGFAIGQQIFVQKKQVEVVGVFKDYKIKPLLSQGYYTNYGGDPGFVLTYKNYLHPTDFSVLKKISFRLASVHVEEALSEVEDYFKEIFPGEVFNWYFLDQLISEKYRRQQIAQNQIGFFTVLAIGIACLGLLGMITNRATQKTKELGIRKVLGAKLYHIARILLSTTVNQIIIATVISIPIAYYLTDKYLEQYTERVTLEWWHFALPIVMLGVIMLATVASVLWKAARTNPVEALKHE